MHGSDPVILRQTGVRRAGPADPRGSDHRGPRPDRPRTGPHSVGCRPDLEGDRRWMAWVLALAVGFTALTVVRSVQVGILVRDPHGAFFASRLALSLGLFVILAAVDAGARVARPHWSWGNARRSLRRRWPTRRLAVALTGLLAYHLVYFSYHNLKSWVVFNTPRDAMLLRWDRTLFLGHSPAVLLHDLLGQHVAAFVLTVIYESFSSLVSVSVVAALVFTTRLRDGLVFIASALWVWILGVGSYYVIPSLGPFDSAPQEFAGLPHTMIQGTQASYLAQREYLLSHPQASDAFAQVSAFASLHVAVTFVIVLMARYYGLRRTTRVLAAFLVATVVATVYLGWHFAVDDIAGLAIGGLAVFLGRLMVYPRGRSAVPPGSRAGGDA